MTWFRCTPIGGGITEYSQMNDSVAAFIKNVEYGDDYSTTQVVTYVAAATDYSKEEPKGIEISAGVAIEVTDWYSHLKWTVASENGKCKIYNVIPSGIGETPSRLIRPTGNVRMIYVPSVYNVRDLGGWSCDGGSVKYGKIFRGGEFTGTNSNEITAEDITRLKEQCGIKFELDLRSHAEASQATASDLGSNVEYYRQPILYYANAVKTLADAAHTATAIKKVFSAVADGEPVYFHCVSGADRTGTLSFILLTLLGVSASDKDKEYELTAFSDEVTARRYRNTNYSVTNGNSWYALVSYFQGFHGISMQDKVLSWCLSQGITIAEINKFREQMIDGTPAALTSTYKPCRGITLNKTSVDIQTGKTDTLVATTTPAATDDAITWTSSAPDIAMVENGVVTAKATGSATITAFCGFYSTTCAVTVKSTEFTWTEIQPETTNKLKISSSDGVTETTSNQYAASAYIDLGGYEKIRLTDTYDAPSTKEASLHLYCYDANKTFLGSKAEIKTGMSGTVQTVTYDIDSNVRYARLRYYASDQTIMVPYLAAMTVEVGK